MFEMAKMLFGNSIFSSIARFPIVFILVQQNQPITSTTSRTTCTFCPFKNSRFVEVLNEVPLIIHSISTKGIEKNDSKCRCNVQITVTFAIVVDFLDSNKIKWQRYYSLDISCWYGNCFNQVKLCVTQRRLCEERYTHIWMIKIECV